MNPITEITSIEDSPEALLLADQLMQSVAATLRPFNVGPAHFAVLPPGYDRKNITDDVERAQTTPNRKRGSIKLADLPSLITYCADQASSATGYIFADPDRRAITAVFNDNKAISAGWRDHRAEFVAEFTPEFKRWLENNGSHKAKTQTEFAEFIEDNLADITEPAAHQLLEVATTIQAKTDISFSSAKRLQDGQVQLGYTETINATAGVNGGLTIPKEFQLGLRIFKNGTGYIVKARLKYRLGNGNVKFWYELDRPERAVEDAFAGYVDMVREQSGYSVLVGAAS